MGDDPDSPSYPCACPLERSIVTELDEIGEAWEAGYAAAASGESRYSNPYRDELARHWRAGYEEALGHMNDDVDGSHD